jgi:hypothetical protein
MIYGPFENVLEIARESGGSIVPMSASGRQ